MEVNYKIIRYSWLPADPAHGVMKEGWGIMASAESDPAFCRSCEELMSGTRAPEDDSLAVYFTYSAALRRHVFISARRLPALARMGGGDNNKLVSMYIPDCKEPEKLLACPPDFEDTQAGRLKAEAGRLKAETEPLKAEAGRLKAEAEPYGFHALLEKYGLCSSPCRADKGADKETDNGIDKGIYEIPEENEKNEESLASPEQKRLAVFLSNLYLSFVSDAWKDINYYVYDGNDLQKAIDITTIIFKCIPEEIFGRKREQIGREIGFTCGNVKNSSGFCFPAGSAAELSAESDLTFNGYMQHNFFFDQEYEPERQLTREYMDRKVENSGTFFMALAASLQSSEEAGRGFIGDILRLAADNRPDDIAALAKCYETLYVPWKRFDGLDQALYECRSLSGLYDYVKAKPENILQGIDRYCRCRKNGPEDYYLIGGVELLKLLSDSIADPKLARRMMDEYTDPERFEGLLPDIGEEERNKINEILKKVREYLFLPQDTETLPADEDGQSPDDSVTGAEDGKTPEASMTDDKDGQDPGAFMTDAEDGKAPEAFMTDAEDGKTPEASMTDVEGGHRPEITVSSVSGDSHESTAERMDNLLKNKKSGFFSIFGSKK